MEHVRLISTRALEITAMEGVFVWQVEQPESTPVPTPGTGEVRTSGSRSRMRRRPLVPVASSSAGSFSIFVAL